MWGRRLFRWRGYTPVPLLLLLIWLARPTPSSLLAGLPFLLAGESLRVWAVRHAGRATRSRRIGATETLAMTGPYARLRHPIYLGNLLLFAGAGLAGCASRPALCLSFLAAVLLLLGAQYLWIARAEEAWMAERFGPVFEDYARAVPRWLPRRRPAELHFSGSVSAGPLPWAEALRSERSTLLLAAAILIFFMFRLKT